MRRRRLGLNGLRAAGTMRVVGALGLLRLLGLGDAGCLNLHGGISG
ncbi:MAG: hypothetical protein WCJ30_01460 [Deltaproteobacteria bacterium]